MIERVLGRRALPPRRLPTFFLLIVLLGGIGFGYAVHRFATTTAVQMEGVNAPGAEPAFIPAVAAEVVPLRPVHAIGHVVTGDKEGLYGGTETSSCDAAAIRT